MTTRESDRLRSGSNPFDNAFVRTPWDRSFVDVPAINSRASDLIARKVADARESGESVGLVLVGEPGYGKSHLLARLRHQSDPGKLLTFVEPPRAPNRVMRHILRESIVRLGTTQFTELTQLEQLAYDYVLGLLHELVVTKRVTSPALVKVVTRAAEELLDFATLHQAIQPNLDDILDHALAAEPVFERNTLRAFFGLVHECRTLRVLAMRWLRGDVLADEDLGRLGVEAPENTEERAHETLAQVLRICAATEAVLVVCVDQVEEVNDGQSEKGTGIRSLTTALSDLIQFQPALVVVMACLQERWEAFQGGAVRKSHLDRIAQTVVHLKPVDADEARELIRARLERFNDVQGSRVAAEELFDLDALDRWVAQTVVVSPRQVLHRCAGLVDLFREGTAELPLGAEPSTQVPVSDALRQQVDQARIQRQQNPAPKPIPSGTMIDGEPRVPPPLAPQERDEEAPALSLDPIGWYFGAFEQTILELQGDPARELANVDEQDLTATMFEVLQVLCRRRVTIAGARLSSVRVGGYLPSPEYRANSLSVTLDRNDTAEERGIVLSSADHFQNIRALLSETLDVMSTTPGFIIRTLDLRNTYRKSREIMRKMPLGAAFILDHADYLALIAVQRLRHAASAGDLRLGPKTMTREELDGLMIQSGVLEENRIVRTAFQLAPRPIRRSPTPAAIQRG